MRLSRDTLYIYVRTRRRSRNEVAVLLLIKASFFDLKSASWQIEETVDFLGQCLTVQISSSLLLRRVALLLSVCDVLAVSVCNVLGKIPSVITRKMREILLDYLILFLIPNFICYPIIISKWLVQSIVKNITYERYSEIFPLMRDIPKNIF